MDTILAALLTILVGVLSLFSAPFLTGTYFGLIWDIIFPDVDMEELAESGYFILNFLEDECPLHFFTVYVLTFILSVFIFQSLFLWLFK